MTRWISGVVSAIIVLALLYYLPLHIIFGLVVLLALLGFNEFISMTVPHAGLRVRGGGLVLCAGFVTVLLFFSLSGPALAGVLALMLILSCVLFFGEQTEMSLRVRDLAFFIFGLFYVGVLFSFVGWVRGLDQWPFWLFLMLGSTFMSDVGAYVFGRWIGKHKLAPNLSPGKTIEGLLGGVIFSIIGAVIVRILFRPDYPVGPLLGAALVISLVGPIGDLSESLIKRGAGVKDSGKFMPGHGGILDRLDALLFTAPVVYFWAYYFS